MPRVLRILNRFNLGGPSFNAAYLTKYLSPEFETLLIGGEKDEHEDSSLFIFEDMGIPATVIPEMRREINPILDRQVYQRIKQIITKFKPDIVHTHAAKAGALGRLAAFNMKTPVIVHTFHGHVLHSYFGKTKTMIFRSVERKLAKKTDAIVAISKKQKSELVDEFDICKGNKVYIIPLGFDLTKFDLFQKERREIFRNKYNIDDDEIAVGIVGRLVPVKNHELFLKGFAIVSARTTQKMKAVVIGDGKMRTHLEQLVDKLQIRNKVVFTSWIREIEVAYPGLDIVALTSFNEGTPVSLIEAQAAGKPVISSRVGGVEDVILEGKSGLLFESGNMDGFADALMKMLEIRYEMEQSGREFVKANFHYTELVKNTCDLYNLLLKNT